jgi:hypothetical protein
VQRGSENVSTAHRRSGKHWHVAKQDKTDKLSWPSWAPWVLLAVAATCVLTVATTLYDIL